MKNNLKPIGEFSQDDRDKIERYESSAENIQVDRDKLAAMIKKLRHEIPKEERKAEGIEKIRKEKFSPVISPFMEMLKKKKSETAEEKQSNDQFEQDVFDWLDGIEDRIEKQDQNNEIVTEENLMQRAQTKYEQIKSHLSGISEEEITRYFSFLRKSKTRGIKVIKRVNEVAEKIESRREEIETDPLVKNKNEKIKALDQEKAKLFSKYEQMIMESPDLFLLLGLTRLREAKEVLDNGGGIVETAYVKSLMERIDRELKNRPVFIHGELGSGKTELAKHLSRKKLSRPHLKRWEKNNPTPLDDNNWKNQDEYNSLCKIKDPNSEQKKRLEELNAEKKNRTKDLQEKSEKWEKLRQIQSEPLVISGYRHIELEQILGGISLKKAETLEPEEQVATIRQAIIDYAKSNQSNNIAYLQTDTLEKDIDNINAHFENTLEKMVATNADSTDLNKEIETLRKAYLEKFSNPVETKVYLSSFYQAMKEGRPLIIDEMNAIPHHILIMLNDLLTVKPGTTIKPMINDADPFVVQEGFKVIATGNWNPEDDRRYVGRQPIDAAFLSRFSLVQYDYLPNDITGQVLYDLGPDATAEDIEIQRELRQKNELLMMIMARMVDNNLRVKWPKGSMEKINQLARMARVLQDIFSGKEMDSNIFGTQNIPGMSADRNPRELLQENVLSLRHLIPIITQWKEDGFAKPLDDYLYINFVDRSSARPDEQKYLYGILRNVGGFFKEKTRNADGSEGYIYPESSDKLKDFDINSYMYEYNPLTHERRIERKNAENNNIEMEEMNSRELVEKLFGQIPERKIFDKDILGPSVNEEKIESIQNIFAEIGGLYQNRDNFRKMYFEDKNALLAIKGKRSNSDHFKQQFDEKLQQIISSTKSQDFPEALKYIESAVSLIVNELHIGGIIEKDLRDNYLAGLGQILELENISEEQILGLTSKLIQVMHPKK